MALDLKTMTWDEAVEAAKAASGLTNDEIAREMRRRTGQRLTSGNVQRWFNPDDDYWPSAAYLPMLCDILGNDVMIDWLAAQREAKSRAACAGLEDLLRMMPKLASELGDVGRVLDETLDDGDVDADEARRLREELIDVREHVAGYLDMLEKIARDAK